MGSSRREEALIDTQALGRFRNRERMSLVTSAATIEHRISREACLPGFEVQRSMLDVRCSFYSYRSAFMGSILAARRAGTHAANRATAINTAITVVSVAGSAVCTP